MHCSPSEDVFAQERAGEEEPEDPKPKLVERKALSLCSWTKTLTTDAINHSCPAEKHHFDACAARVAKAEENPEQGAHHGHPEDCAEEFLHLMHCVDKTIAEPLFRQLK